MTNEDSLSDAIEDNKYPLLTAEDNTDFILELIGVDDAVNAE